MSYDAMVEIRGYLCSSSNVTSLVPKSQILVGWPQVLDKFPSILITQTAGTDTGYLGYNTSPAGSKLRSEEVTLELDIFAKTRLETYNIADVVVPVLIASGSCKKINDVDLYDDALNVYRKLSTYSFIKFHDD